MTKLYQILIWLSSVGVLTCFVKMYVLMFLVMSVIIVLSSKFIGKSLSKAVVITDIAVLVSAFFTLKSSLGLILPLGYSVFVFSAISLIIQLWKFSVTYSSFQRYLQARLIEPMILLDN